MLHYLYGDENFLIQEKIKELIGKTKPIRFDLSRDIDENQLSTVLSGGSLFGSSPVLLQNPAEYSGRLALEEILKNHADLLVIVVDSGKPTKKHTLVKHLLKNAKNFEGQKMKYGQVRSWIRDRFGKYNGTATPDQIEQIAIITDGDLGQANKLIEKLSIYYLGKDGWLADKEVFENLVGHDVAGTIFTLIEAIAGGQSKKAYSLLHKLTSAGENELYILSMITYQFRKLILTRALLDEGASKQKIAREAGIPFFNLDSTIATARKYSMDKLKKIYSKLLDAEISIKTGRTEPSVLLDLLVLALAK
ncbi:DNA polymerase III subunit delta [Patescibacteria group bacterium]